MSALSVMTTSPSIENILNFEQVFKGAKTIRLEQNYRSTSNILNAANSVIKNNAGRKGKTLWTQNGNGEKVHHYTASNEQDEASHLADIIGEHLREGAHLRDHAVLYRMNAQSNPIETYFARAGIPYRIVGGQRFFDRKEVKDINSYLAVIVNPRDDVRLRRIINEPPVRSVPPPLKRSATWPPKTVCPCWRSSAMCGNTPNCSVPPPRWKNSMRYTASCATSRSRCRWMNSPARS